MFKRISDKRGANKKDERELRPQTATSANPGSVGDQPLDAALLALSRELSALGQMEVSRAAKERGWASLEHELERRPVRPAAGATRRSMRPTRNWRWAIASAAAFVAVVAGVLGAYSAGAFQTAYVADSGSSSTVTSAVTSGTTQPASPSSTQPATSTTQPGASTTEPGSSTTGTHPSTTGTQPSSPSTTQPGSSTTLPRTDTTQPSAPSTGEQQMAATEREDSARAAVTWLANLVITGDNSGAQALVDAGARSSLTHMVMSLTQPSGYEIPSIESLSGGIARVTLVIQDRVDNGQGQTVTKDVSFIVNVRVGPQSAVITAISAGS